MSEQSQRGAAEEAAGVPDTSAEHEGPASPASLPGGDASARGAGEDAAGVAPTEPNEQQQDERE